MAHVSVIQNSKITTDQLDLGSVQLKAGGPGIFKEPEKGSCGHPPLKVAMGLKEEMVSLDVCPADLAVAMIKTIERLCNETNVEMHPLLSIAVARVNAHIPALVQLAEQAE